MFITIPFYGYKCVILDNACLPTLASSNIHPLEPVLHQRSKWKSPSTPARAVAPPARLPPVTSPTGRVVGFSISLSSDRRESRSRMQLGIVRSVNRPCELLYGIGIYGVPALAFPPQ